LEIKTTGYICKKKRSSYTGIPFTNDLAFDAELREDLIKSLPFQAFSSFLLGKAAERLLVNSRTNQISNQHNTCSNATQVYPLFWLNCLS